MRIRAAADASLLPGAYLEELRARRYSLPRSTRRAARSPRLFSHLREEGVRTCARSKRRTWSPSRAMLTSSRRHRGGRRSAAATQAPLPPAREELLRLPREREACSSGIPRAELALPGSTPLPRAVLTERQAGGSCRAFRLDERRQARPRDPRDALRTGLRRGECARLDVADLDLAREDAPHPRTARARRTASSRARPRRGRPRRLPARLRPVLAQAARASRALPHRLVGEAAQRGLAELPAATPRDGRPASGRSTRTRCGTPAPRICFGAAPTSATSRRSSATATSRRRPSTRGSRSRTCARSSGAATHARSAGDAGGRGRLSPSCASSLRVPGRRPPCPWGGFYRVGLDLSGFEYNARGRKTKEIDPLLRETVYVYGNNNTPDANPTTGDGVDLLQIKQKNGTNYELFWSATYNAQHRPLTITDAAGQTTGYTYNSAGQVLTVTTPERAGISENRTTTYVYDTNGYLQSVTGPAAGATTSRTYDAYGRVRTVTDSDNYTLTYDYDALDRVTKVTYPDTTFEEAVYNPLDAEKQRDRLGRWTQTFYDALRRPVAVRDAAGQTTQYQYGGSGCASCGAGGDKLTKLVDANGNATAWEYDVQGRVAREIEADGAATEYTYENTSSRMKEVLEPKSQRRTYEYFLDNRLEQVTYQDAVIATPTVSLTYDPSYARLATLTDGTGTTTFTYHPSGQLGAGGALASVDGPQAGDGDKVTYSYDEVGRAVRREINGTANVTTQAFDSLHRLTGETNLLGASSYGYQGVTSRLARYRLSESSASRRSTISTTPATTGLRRSTTSLPVAPRCRKFNFATSALGLISSLTQQADTAAPTSYEFGRDPVDRLTAAVLKSTDPTPSILKSYGYRYDGAGNRTIEAVDTAVVTNSYDSVNEQLQQQAGGSLRFVGTVSEPAAVTVGGASAQVSSSNRFEGAANVTPGTNTVTVVATDPSGNVRTNTYEVGVGGTAKSFTHDPNGNQTSDGTRSYEWDAEPTGGSRAGHEAERVHLQRTGATGAHRREGWSDRSE